MWDKNADCRTPYITSTHTQPRSHAWRGKWLTRKQFTHLHASFSFRILIGQPYPSRSSSLSFSHFSLSLSYSLASSIFPWALFLYSAFLDAVEGFFFKWRALGTVNDRLAFLMLSSSAAPVTAAASFDPIGDHRFSAFASTADVDLYWDSTPLPHISLYSFPNRLEFLAVFTYCPFNGIYPVEFYRYLALILIL